MRWDQGHESPDVIDRRGQGGGRMGGGGMGGILAFAPFLLRSKVGIVILLLLIGGSFLLRMVGTSSTDAPQVTQTTSGPTVASKPGDASHFVAFVLDDAQKNWQELFGKAGRQYRNAKLVLFTDATSTACGYGQAATGPFYCPGDERVYIDLSFYDDLSRRFGAKGDFAEAYVIAHEIGHHVQKQLGLSNATQGLRQSEREGATGASVRLELQADCFAGVWAHSTQARGLLEAGDVDEALNAASAIGDDRLQKEVRGRVSPETFTHGSAAQRAKWFKIGLQSGDPNACDTFQTRDL